MNQETVERVTELVQQVADGEGIEVEEFILFGSRAREDYTERSDVDIVIVSEDFSNTDWYNRGEAFQRQWNYKELPSPEIICLTPEEFEERKQKLGDIVKTAAEEGIEI